MNTSITDRIEKSIELSAPLTRVWRALTDYQEFSTWFGVNLETPFVPGQPTKGTLAYPGYEHVVLEVIVERMEPERLFSYRWHPYAMDAEVDYSQEPMTLVEFTLEPTAGGTRLTVTESGFDSIPAQRRDEAFRMNEGGWAAQLKSIEEYVTPTP